MISLPVRAEPSRDQSFDSPDDSKHKHRSKRQRTAQPIQLCLPCQQLDLDKLFQEASEEYQKVRNGSMDLPCNLYVTNTREFFYSDAIAMHHFEDRLSQPSQCPLCTFFRSQRVEPGVHNRYKLLAFRSSESWMFELNLLKKSKFWDKFEDTVFMAVVPDSKSIPEWAHGVTWLEKQIPATGAIYRLSVDECSEDDHRKLLSARLVGARPNFALVREWLKACRDNHRASCRLPKSREPISRGFRLINCAANPPVVEAKDWGTPYAALSYVWGSSPADMKEWPNTVIDAITVTTELSLQYLWVDRLCIDDADRSMLITRMTTIYKEAEITIVAAAGAGADYGLPGIRSTPRNPQPKYELESGNLLVSTLADPRGDILDSNYWKRGWTYQEGILSRRRVVFTDNQIYWECDGMATYESIQSPLFWQLSNNDWDSERHMADFMLSGIFKGLLYNAGARNNYDGTVIQDETYLPDYGFPIYREVSVRAALRGLNEHIRAYSKRRLRYDTDVLPAFLGILGLFEPNELLYMLYGLPICMGSMGTHETGAWITLALSVTSWYHRADANHRMFVSEPCNRRTHLPSWTWAGWDGPVTWRAPPNYEHGTFMGDLMSSRNVRCLWVAEMQLYNPDQPRPTQPLSAPTSGYLELNSPTLIEVRNPLVLKYSVRKKTQKKWRWMQLIGREGREQANSESPDWDDDWYRIAGRLCFIGMSISITAKEWTEKHKSDELISVLMFASKDTSSEHGRARFLTLRRAGPQSLYWERVGMLSLIIPEVSISKYPDAKDFLKEIPVRSRKRLVVIQ